MHEELSYAGETASRNRMARLMSRHGLLGVPRHRSIHSKCMGVRPDHARNHLERDFSAPEPNTKWVTDITCIHTGEGWLYLCTVLDLYNHKIVGWSMSGIQDRHMVIKAVLMAAGSGLIGNRWCSTPIVARSLGSRTRRNIGFLGQG